MAYQPKSYRKFLATSVAAAMVATAVAPAAIAAEAKEVSFKDFNENSRGADQVFGLVNAGVIQGQDGNFNPDVALKRGDAAVIIARTLGLIDLEGNVLDGVDTDAEDFTDVAEGSRYYTALAALRAADIIGGKADGSFAPTDTISRGEMAIIVAKAFQLEAKTDSNPFKDLGKSNAAAVQALYDNEITSGMTDTTFGANEDMKRRDFAIFTYKSAVQAGIIKDGDVEVVVNSVSAINAKTIEVTFNNAVEDPSKATVELLRGTFKQNATIVWAEDKKSVQLVGASNFQAADYTVTVAGLTEEKLTGSVTIEAQKVASIEILDDIAVVSASTGDTVDAGAKATVAYVVKDQYGTDISKTVSLSSNNNTTIKAVNGVVTLEAAEVAGKKLGTLVPVVLIDTATGTSASKTLKLSAESAVSTIAVAGVYNAKGEAVALNDKSKANEAFIVLDLKDQYGKEITDPTKAAGLVITNTNTTNLTINSSVTKIKIGDKDRLVIELSSILKAGNTDVLLISTTNGQSAKYTVQVNETATTDAISVSQPEIAVAGEPTLIPLTVTDKAGNVITDKKLLSDASKGIKVANTTVTEAELEVKDGQVYYKKTLSAGTQAFVFQTSTYKVATVTVNVRAAAIPTVVRGLKKPLLISTAQGPVTINATDHLVIEDQYGRVINNSSAPVTAELVGTTDVVTLSGNVVTPAKNGTATLKISLVTPNGTIESAVEVRLQVTDGTQYSDYEINEIGKTEADVAKAITVNGLLNGGKVALDPTEYTATISGGKLEGPTEVTGGNVTVANTDLNTDASSNELDTEFTLRVTVNATGKVLEQKFVVSSQARQVQDFFFTATETTGNYSLAKSITEATLESGSTVASLKSDTAVVNVATVDQYGNKAIAAIGSPTVTIVPDKAGEVTIVANGTNGATVSLNTDVTESFVTLNVKIGNATKELRVKVVTP